MRFQTLYFAQVTAVAYAAVITPAPQLAKRQLVNSVCGYYSDNAGETWTITCGVGVPCVKYTEVVPNIGFCSLPGALPKSIVYGYGNWPVGGCLNGQWCCPSTRPYNGEFLFDQGATYLVACFPSGVTTIYATTALENQVPVPLPPVTTSVTVPVTPMTTPITTPAAAPTTIPAAASTTTPATTSTPATFDTTNSSQSGGLSTGAKIGAIVGPVVSVIGVCVAIYFGRKNLKKRKEHPHMEGGMYGQAERRYQYAK